MRALLVTLLLLAATPARAEDAMRRFALIVGANDGGADRVRLRYAGTDARAIASVLEELGAVRPEDRLLILEPNRFNFEAALAEIERRMKAARTGDRRIELVLYYSGHSDENGLLLRGDLYPYSHLRTALRDAPADVRIAILDSCSSGALTRGKGGVKRAPFVVDRSSQVRGHAYLTSSSETEAAQESDRIKGSFFTHYLLTGLRGAADVTRDGRVTLNEAYHFAFSETLARTEKTRSGPQHPAYDIQLAGSGDLVMTDLRGSGAALEVEPAVAGRLFVRGAGDVLVAELRKPAGRPLDLGLDPGPYRLTVEDGGRVREARVTLARGKRTRVLAADLRSVTLEATAARGGRAAPEPAGELRRVPLSLGVLPAVAISGPEDRVATNLSFNLVAGRVARVDGIEASLVGGFVSEDVRGLELALGGSIVDRDLTGVQAGLVGNRTGRHFDGLQVAVGVNQVGSDPSSRARGIQAAVGFNHTEGSLLGIQSAVGANFAGGDSEGIQAAFGANFVDRSLTGAQTSFGFNRAGGHVGGLQTSVFGNWAGLSLTGVQASLGSNVVGREARGLQVAVGFNRAESLQGLQVALLNVGGDVQGAQVGLLNVGRDVSGLQLGLVNISRDAGVPIGLVNWVDRGRLDLELSASELFPLNATAKLGSRNVYGYLTGGLAGDAVAYGAGVGAHLDAGRFDVTTELQATQLRGWDLASGENVLASARATIGYELVRGVTAYAGPTYNVFTQLDANDAELPLSFAQELDAGASTRVSVWPGVTAGVRFTPRGASLE